MKVIDKQVYIVGFRKTDNDEWRDNVGNKYDFAVKFIEKYSKLKGVSHENS